MHCRIGMACINNISKADSENEVFTYINNIEIHTILFKENLKNQ